MNDLDKFDKVFLIIMGLITFALFISFLVWVGFQFNEVVKIQEGIV